jgi:pyruvate dehydrogenase complex dehydrogenase (E1) component
MQLHNVQQRTFPIPIEYVGTKDTFGESGTPAQLLKKYGLDVPDIVAAAEKVMAKNSFKIFLCLTVASKATVFCLIVY